MHETTQKGSAAGGRGLRLTRIAVAVTAFVGSIVVVVGGSPADAGASGASADRAQISQIEQQIIAQGAAVQQIVSESDVAQARLSAAQHLESVDDRRLSADRSAAASALARLRRVAVQSYVSGSASLAGSPELTLFESGSQTKAMAQSEYAGLAAGKLDTAVATYRRDQQIETAAAAAAHGATAHAAQLVATLAADRQRAQVALASDEATLAHVKGNLQAVLAAALQREAAAQRAQEEAMAARQQAAQQAAQLAAQRAAQQAAQLAAQRAAQQAADTGASTPPSPAPGGPAPGGPAPSPGTYANPLRAISALSPERIDQGVDYSGYGPIYAIGNGVVLNTTNAGWPGGTFITYRLTAGPAAGLVVYAAEDIEPMVVVGQDVTSATVLGTMYEGPDGIETGWAGGSGQGYTMAREYGQFSGANSTAFGANFSQLLQALGAPGGVLQNNPPTGTLPAGWPQW
ncbi:MAG: hypothetical protein ACYCV5_01195 [Acidimicrobiales bacterium]